MITLTTDIDANALTIKSNTGDESLYKLSEVSTTLDYVNSVLHIRSKGKSIIYSKFSNILDGVGVSLIPDGTSYADIRNIFITLGL